MCVGAAIGLSTTAGTGLFGLSAATAFNIGLGLTAANAFLGRSAAQQAARQTYQSALAANRSAEDDKRQQQLALAERKAEQEKSAAQDIFAKNIVNLPIGSNKKLTIISPLIRKEYYELNKNLKKDNLFRSTKKCINIS